MRLFRVAVLASASVLGLSNFAHAQSVQPSDAIEDVGRASDREGAAPGDAGEIVVTGTLVRGIAPPGANVIGVTAESVAETGATTTSQMLQTIPQLGSFNTLQTPAGGFTTVTTNRPNLRNLPGDRTSGSSPTLVLVDGHRVVGAGISVTSPDPDIVPPALIERVEIVPDGGSAIYGSDAVAGVINFITKKKFDGVEAGARYGFADNYYTFDANLVAGRSWGTGSVFAAYNFAKNDSIFGRDRDWSFSPLTVTDGLQVQSLRCPGGNVTIGNILTPGVTQTFGLPFVPGVSVPGVVNQCDETDDVTLYPKQTRHSVMLGLNQELTDNITFDVRAFYTERDIVSYIGRYVNSTNFGPAFLAPFGFLPNSFVPMGPTETQTVYYAWGTPQSMRHDNTLNTWGIAPTLTVQLGGGWQMRLLASYGESEARFNGIQADFTSLATAIAAGLVNPYDMAASDPSVLAAVSNFAQFAATEQRQFNGRAILDGELFQLPGGGVKLAVGAEYISEGFAARNGLIVAGTENTGYAGLTVGGVPIIAPHGPVIQSNLSRTTKSVFGEVVVPLFGADNATSLMHEFTLSLAGRYDDYSTVGGTFNPKIGVTWRPVDWVKLRGAWGKSYVAPSLADDPSTTLSSVNFANLSFLLPQPALVGTTVNGVVVPSFAGIAGDRGQVVALGNKPDIQSQKATTWSAGIDVEPPFAPGLRLSATYWNIDYKGIIGFPSFTTPNFYQNFIGTPAVTFNPTSQQIADLFGPNTISIGTDCGGNDGEANNGCYVIIDARKTNLARTKLSGLDFGVNYFAEAGFGSMDFLFNGNYELTRTQQATVTAPFIDQLDANFSRLRFRTSIGANIGNFRAQAAWSHTAGYDLDPPVGVGTTQTKVDAFNVVDLFFKYDFEGDGLLNDLSLTLNVNNVFDEDPPLYLLPNSLQPQNNGYTNGSTLGRLIQFGFNKRF